MAAIPWLLAALLALTMGLALNYATQDRYTPAIRWGFGCWIVFGFGLAYIAMQWAEEHARPQIVFDAMYPISEPNKGFDVAFDKQPVARVVVRNDDRTTAEHAVVKLTIEKRRGPLSKTAIDELVDVELPPIPAGGRRYRTFIDTNRLTQAEVDLLNDRKLNLYVFGSLKYGKQREFRFCYIYNPELGHSRPYEPGTQIYEPCEPD